MIPFYCKIMEIASYIHFPLYMLTSHSKLLNFPTASITHDLFFIFWLQLQMARLKKDANQKHRSNFLWLNIF